MVVLVVVVEVMGLRDVFSWVRVVIKVLYICYC